MNERVVSFMRYHPVRTQRGLEILSGLIPWSLVLFPFIGSFFIPEIVAYFVIAFNVYWLYRSLQIVIFGISGYLNIRATEGVDWLSRLETDRKIQKSFVKIKHLVIVPNVKEPTEILERNLNSLLAQNFNPKNFIVVLAMEERVGKFAHDKADLLLRKYRDKFGKILATFHPLAPGETMGKHSNDTFAAKTVKRDYVDKNKMSIKNILVTIADADTVFSRQYFSLLTYRFLTSPDRYRKFFQAPMFAYNNLHRVPVLVRLQAIVGGIGFLALMQRLSKRAVISANYSTSLSLLDRVGYWDINYIPEDWHLYFKSFFALNGKVELVPLFVPLFIDAAEADSKLATYRNAYSQSKRWAWGIVDIPYVVKNFFLHPEIPIWEKLIKVSIVFEQHFIWSSYWFLITLGATIPTIVNPAFARTALGFNLSKASGLILTLCLAGIITVVVIDSLLNPRNKKKWTTLIHPMTYLQWLLLPVAGLFLGSLPGLESHTRLMLGKYLEYRVTEKKV